MKKRKIIVFTEKKNPRRSGLRSLATLLTGQLYRPLQQPHPMRAAAACSAYVSPNSAVCHHDCYTRRHGQQGRLPGTPTMASQQSLSSGSSQGKTGRECFWLQGLGAQGTESSGQMNQ